MGEVFSLFGQPVTMFGLGAALSMLVLFAASGLYWSRKGVSFPVTVRFAFLALPLAFVMGRLVFVLGNVTYYWETLSNPALALRFWDGGYAMTGVIAGILLAAVICSKWTRTSAGVMLDGAMYGVLPALMTERLFEGFTELGLGRSPSYDWLSALCVDDGYGFLVHPVYRYEAAVALVLFVIITCWVIRNKAIPSGDAALVTLSLLGTTQVIMESLRSDGHMIIFHFVRLQQILFLVGAVVVLIIFCVRAAKKGNIKTSHQLALWLAVVACIGVGIWMEFRVDRGPYKWLYYTVLIACMAVITSLTLGVRKLSNRK